MCNLKRNMNGSGIFYYFHFYVLSLRNLDGTYCSAGRDRVSLNRRSFKDVLRPTWKYWSLEKQFCSVSSWVHDSPHMQVRVLREKLLFTAWRSWSCRPFLLLSESAAVLVSFIWSCTGNNKVQWITLLFISPIMLQVFIGEKYLGNLLFNWYKCIQRFFSPKLLVVPYPRQ